MPGKELDKSSNQEEKVFYRMGPGSLVGGSRNFEFLPEIHQLKDHLFGFVGHRSSEIWNGITDVFDEIFECFSL